MSLRKKEYCILNKQYAKEEYEALVPRIIEHMNAMPHREENGVEYRFGEFFPISMIPFAYNEAVAQEYFPLSKEKALAQGFKWREPETRNYKITMKVADIPDDITQVSDKILEEVIECAHGGSCQDQCTTAFRIIPQELQFYKHAGIPLPDLCPNCRHARRLKLLNPIQLNSRSCECAGPVSLNGTYQNTVAHSHGSQKCSNEFQSPFSLDRKEFIYCEQCYQAEVA